MLREAARSGVGAPHFPVAWALPSSTRPTYLIEETDMTTHKQQGATAQGQDVFALLTEDHKKVQKLFKDFEKLKEEDDEERRQQLVTMICAELTIHFLIEEEFFYPAARDAVDYEVLLDV